MFKMEKRQALHIWIAVLAILFSALAPTVSHALAKADGDANFLILCTSNGKLVQTPLPTDDGKAPASVKVAMEHCSFCTTHGAHAALPLAAALPQMTAGRAVYPPLFYLAPAPLAAWAAANPRAPPILA